MNLPGKRVLLFALTLLNYTTAYGQENVIKMDKIRRNSIGLKSFYFPSINNSPVFYSTYGLNPSFSPYISFRHYFNNKLLIEFIPSFGYSSLTGLFIDMQTLLFKQKSLDQKKKVFLLYGLGLDWGYLPYKESHTMMVGLQPRIGIDYYIIKRISIGFDIGAGWDVTFADTRDSYSYTNIGIALRYLIF